MPRQVSVIGSGARWEAAAEEVGRLLAERGCTVVTGGLGEVMAAAHRGAKAADGVTLAILPGEERGAANRWADHVVVSGIGHARNLADVAGDTSRPPLNPGTVSHGLAMKAACRELGLEPFTPGQFRHSVATWAITGLRSSSVCSFVSLAMFPRYPTNRPGMPLDALQDARGPQ